MSFTAPVGSSGQPGTECCRHCSSLGNSKIDLDLDKKKIKNQTSAPLTCPWAELRISARTTAALRDRFSYNKQDLIKKEHNVDQEKKEEINSVLASSSKSSIIIRAVQSLEKLERRADWSQHPKLFLCPLIGPEESLLHALSEISLTASQSPMNDFILMRKWRVFPLCAGSLTHGPWESSLITHQNICH